MWFEGHTFIAFLGLVDESWLLFLIYFRLLILFMAAKRFVVLRICFIVVPQVVDEVVPQVGAGIVPQVVDGIDVVPQVGDSVVQQVVDIAVGRNDSCSSCGRVSSAIWRI